MKLNKRILTLLLIFALLVFPSYACTLPQLPTAGNSYQVTFVNNNGQADVVKRVVRGESIAKPDDPEKENYLFYRWCTDAELQNEYDFSSKVNRNLTLYAKYIIDYASLTNTITLDIMKRNVTVITNCYNTGAFGTVTTQKVKSGSAIIVKQIISGSTTTYYALTNNHVTYKTSGYSNVSYTVEDYKGETYNATCLYMDADYDLAYVKFEFSQDDYDLGVIEIANSNPQAHEEVIAIGQPEGQNNAITYGAVEDYVDAPSISNASASESNVKFEVIKHSAYIASGSSGGALLDLDLKLVGINYCGSTDENKEFLSAYTVPIQKVKEFLTSAQAYS